MRPRTCALLFLACLAGAFGSILLQEALFPNYALYMLLFVLWGCVYGAAALRGSVLWKAAMASVYGCCVFNLGRAAALVQSWLPQALRASRYSGSVLFLFFSLLAAVILAMHPVTTERKVPKVCWMSLTGVSLIGVGFAYYQMVSDPGPVQAALAPAALNSLSVVLTVIIVQNLCANVIRSYEADLVRLSLDQNSQEQAGMAREAGRTEDRLRKYRHETVNHLNTLSALLEKGDTESTRALIGQMTSAPAPASDRFHSGNPLFDAIFNQKMEVCRERGIDFSADLVLSETLPLTDTELSSLLGNLLNNAIEGAAKCGEPFVRTRIYPARDYLCVEVVNSADGAMLTGNPDLVTTKADPELHGIGLKVIREIADRHHGMTSFEADREGRFTARVMIRLSA